ncbi:MAG: hypothetical protein COW65_10270 [Cytophagales bacterium CG18_big_fil_WC_8_21_14_2_50_42_9]|nr:MAG: hypothetical protein COW65_10270 [Cytophagales bacterium CG18_big_fil_WC_8_21_14_2_50_42_9]
MNWDNIELLLQKYYAGETSLAEENVLNNYFKETKLLPNHLKVHAAQFEYYNHQQEVQLDKFLADDWLFEKIERPNTEPAFAYSWKKLIPYGRVAASILLLLAAFWVGNHYRQRVELQNNSEMAAMRAEILEMKRVLATGSDANSSASERIRVVSQEFNLTQNQEVIKLFIRTMNHDPNVNVRFAACEALYRFKDNELVRDAFIQSLPLQPDPFMQIMLIDILVGIKEKKAVNQLQKLSQKENLLPMVKNKAQQGINILI